MNDSIHFKQEILNLGFPDSGMHVNPLEMSAQFGR